ncbi:hypothetical protein [Sphingobacterium sp. JB170]|uniref:hypothetical protein n=1 Tax=Sphingobacterium sp. JB170 TaxID=1434842 RepID=UPI00097EDBA9|nr:hypothetical protein [Sphingobacterium sp. JB170]SJN17705.1 hypothetical protein FM107_01075 [Sphingobacterium sp. JB170]
MRFNTLFVASVCASALLASCNPKTAEKNQLKYTHTSIVDGDAYEFFKVVGSKLVYESDYAAYAASVAKSPQAKQLAEKVNEVYSALIPAVDSLATQNQVDFPIKGAEVFKSPVVAAVDSVETEHAVKAYSDEAYIHHVLHEVTIIKDRFERLSRNTGMELREFGSENEEKINEIFTLAGGKADEHGHH